MYPFFIPGSKQVHLEIHVLHNEFRHSTSCLHSYELWLMNYSYKGVPVTLIRLHKTTVSKEVGSLATRLKRAWYALFAHACKLVVRLCFRIVRYIFLFVELLIVTLLSTLRFAVEIHVV